MDRDFVIGMILIFVILVGWSYLSPKNEPTPADEAATAQATTTPGMSAPPGSAATPAATVAATPSAALAQVDGAAPATDAPPVEVAPMLPPVTIDDDKVIAAFSNVGGRVASWKLKSFNDVAGPKGEPLDLIATQNSGRLPMSTYWVGSGPTMAEKDTYRIVRNAPDGIVFERDDPAGFRITKAYTPDFDKYRVDLKVTIRSLGTASAQGRLSMSLFHEFKVEKSSFFKPNLNITQFAAFVGGNLETKPLEKAVGISHPGNVMWSGFENVYFLSAVAPGVSETTQVQVLGPQNPTDPIVAVLTLPETTIAPGGEATFDFHAYFGPKGEDVLIAAGHGFDRAIDFGWFSAIAKLLVRFLQLLYGWTGNWGIAIIITTIIVKLLMYPLTYKSYKSMKAMSALAPLMQELRERYKEDREKLNQEMMALYKAHNVNPASGCLPLLLQLPVFLAFYRALYGTIELRHAPFAWWIQDLSAPDPYYVTPIIMGLTMVITQKMTPSSADPVQQKMMMLMPVVFTFMFLSFPSGLVLYWLVSNILTIAQQFYMNRSGLTPGAPPKPAVKAA